MGQNDSGRHNECVQLLIRRSASNVAPVEMMEPIRPAEKSVNVRAWENICMKVEWWRWWWWWGGIDDACWRAVREDICMTW